MEVDDDVESQITRPTDDSIQVSEATSRKMLAVRVHQILVDPIAHRDTNGVETARSHILQIILRDPRVPVTLERSICSGLAQLEHAVELAAGAGAAHVGPRG